MRFFLLALLCCLSLPAVGEILLERSLNKPEDLKGLYADQTVKLIVGEGVTITGNAENPGRGTCGLRYSLPLEKIAGKRVVFTVESRRDMAPPLMKWQGGKFMVSFAADGREDWPGIYLPPGKHEWKSLRFVADFPVSLQKASLLLGIQAAEGVISFRNLKVELCDGILPIGAVANMGLRDEFAGDGKGGWSDQGKDNDAAKFRFGEREFGGIPFLVADPAKNKGKSVLVMRSPRFPQGPERVEIPLDSAKISGRKLYLLHTLSWGNGAKQPVGSVEAVGKNGHVQTFEILPGKDVADWWTPSRHVNACPVSVWRNSRGGLVGVYASGFALDPALGELKRVSFRSAGTGPVWIICAATISAQNYPFPEEKKYVIREGRQWKRPAPASVIGVLAGSALDLSWLSDGNKTGEFGRLIITPQGAFAFEKRPDVPVRFLASALITDPFYGRRKHKADFVTKAKIEEFSDLLVRGGYNMMRMHFLDSVLMTRQEKDYQFNPQYLDMFDYMIFCFKQRGIYLNLDAMSSQIGYSHGYSWFLKPGDTRNFKLDIHFKPEVRENWRRGLETLLNHVNPYTGVRLLDDPILTMIVGFNEQEFAFGRDGLYAQGLPQWREFLQKRYGTIDKLKAAWGKEGADLTGFDQIAAFTAAQLQSSSALGNDLARFLIETEKKTYEFYRTTLRELGFKGPIANYNMGQSLRYMIVRADSDFIAMNSYHAHPFGDAINPESSVGSMARIMRGLTSTRSTGKPFAVTEHGHAYWNNFRYEQGLVMGGYAAFQNFDVLTAFATPVASINEEHKIETFMIKTDPITRAAEFLTALQFLRQDVKKAPAAVRLTLAPEVICATGGASDSLNTEESALALVTGLSVELESMARKGKAGELILPALGGSGIVFQTNAGGAGYMRSIEKKSLDFNFNATIAALKKAGDLPSGNRSDFKKGIFESSTGELYLDAPREFLSVDTPRFQGVCAKAGVQIKLTDVEIQQLTTRGCLAVVGVDRFEPLKTARRIVVVYATNAFNSGTVFADADHRIRLNEGSTPVLLETGSFSLRLCNRNAARFKCYALGLDGARLSELPLTVKKDFVELNVNTAELPHGPGLYFELIADE